MRLHAVRDYYSMAALLRDHPRIHLTINLTPSLLHQVEDYAERGATDRALELTLTPAGRLGEAEREEILSSFFDADWHNQIFPHPRYKELFLQRVESGPFSSQDLCDLQMWFNLAWFGKEFRDGAVELPGGERIAVHRLVEQGRGYGEADLREMASAQLAILRAVIAIHRALERSGQIELSTTPFYHPILPLLVDTDGATIDRPGATHPSRFAHPEDAEAQVQRAVESHRRRFDRSPRMWPAEGAVSRSVVPIFARHGLEWIATDGGVLARSGKWGYPVDDPDVLCQPYRAEEQGHRIAVFFRDAWLSDAIGFRYHSYEDHERAARDFVGEVKARFLGGLKSTDDRVLTIVLDGENAWGAYRDDGRPFLHALYDALQRDSEIQTVTFAEYLGGNPARGVRSHPLASLARVHDLFTGSWIDENGSAPGVDLGTWIGEEAENRAWEMLGKAREVFEQASAGRTNAAVEAVYAAEGSDWFWWFGADQDSGSDEEFDDLFRMHLRNIYRGLGLEPPAELERHIVSHPVVWSFSRQVHSIQAGDRLTVSTNCPGELTWQIGSGEARSAALSAVGGVMAGVQRYGRTLGPFPETARSLRFRFRCTHPGCECRHVLQGNGELRHDRESFDRRKQRRSDSLAIMSMLPSGARQDGGATIEGAGEETKVVPMHERALFGLRFLRQLAQVGGIYWRSSERRKGAGLLAITVVLELAMVYGNVLLSEVQRQMFDAFGERRMAAFSSAVGLFLGAALLFVLISTYRIYVRGALEIGWRTSLTDHFVKLWMSRHAYCEMELHRKLADNPDQRIAEDVRDFVASALGLSLSLLSALATLASFAAILWSLSAHWSLTLSDGRRLVIPGLMMWVAIAYALLASWLTHRVGRSLVPIQFERQRFEADFRYSLVRFRENVEPIALAQGEAGEQRLAMARFRDVVTNWWQLITAQRNLSLLTTGIGQANSLVPVLVAAPAYFAGHLSLGSVMQTRIAYGEVSGALTWFVNAYQEIARWRASVERLVTLNDEIERAAATAELREAVRVEPTTSGTLRLDDLRLERPDGTVLIEDANGELEPGERVALSGPTGAGKRTLLRAIAGIWRFGSGRIEMPVGSKAAFLPMRPHLPIGTLREALAYPDSADGFDDERLHEALELFGLRALVGRLDESAHWEQLLSDGEQQRLALARAYLHRPDWLFLDGATSSLDEEAEAHMYDVLREHLPRTAIVSIADRSVIEKYHDRRWRLVPRNGATVLEATR